MKETAALATSVFANDPDLRKTENRALRTFLAQSTAKIAASVG